MTAELGDKVKCYVTGIIGIVVSKSKHLYGCDRIGIQPPSGPDNKLVEAVWCDIDAAEVIQKAVVRGHTMKTAEARTGGPSLPGMVETRSDNPR